MSLASSLLQRRLLSKTELGLEIVFPNNTRPPIMLGMRLGTRHSALINRRYLPISNPGLAGELTALEIRAEEDDQKVNVTLAIIYGDLSNQESWKDKRVIGSFLIGPGDSLQTLGLIEFGIDPIELRMVVARPIVFEKGKGPIINNTTALEVVSLTKTLDAYHLQLKNVSDKNVIGYTVHTGLSGSGIRVEGYKPVLRAGEVSDEISIRLKGEVTIASVVFEDGTFEGDATIAWNNLAMRDGMRIQAPRVLQMIEQTLTVNDVELTEASEKLESELWLIPEAIDKPSALEYLRAKNPSLDEKTVSSLYEELKGGLYKARNIALADLGELKRYLERARHHAVSENAFAIRARLNHIKTQLEEIISSKDGSSRSQ